jgi:hypothetical protein
MTPNDLAHLSPQEFGDFIIAHFERQGYTLEECQPASAGQLLLFRMKGISYVVFYLSNTPPFGPLSDVTPVEVAWGIQAVENPTAACGYVITRSLFSFIKYQKLS